MSKIRNLDSTPEGSSILLLHSHVTYSSLQTVKYPYKPTRVVSACFFPTHMYHRKISRMSPNIELLQSKYVNNGIPIIKPLKRKMYIVGIGCNFYFLEDFLNHPIFTNTLLWCDLSSFMYCSFTHVSHTNIELLRYCSDPNCNDPNFLLKPKLPLHA